LTGVTSYWLGENSTITTSDPTATMVQLVAKKLACATKVSNELLADNAISVASWLAQEYATSLSGAIDDAAFNGTGTTGAVAKRLGRNYIGFERDRDYAAAAEARIAAIEPLPEATLAPFMTARSAPRVAFSELLERGLIQPGTRRIAGSRNRFSRNGRTLSGRSGPPRLNSTIATRERTDAATPAASTSNRPGLTLCSIKPADDSKSGTVKGKP
jgi:hypothetical protein